MWAGVRAVIRARGARLRPLRRPAGALAAVVAAAPLVAGSGAVGAVRPTAAPHALSPRPATPSLAPAPPSLLGFARLQRLTAGRRPATSGLPRPLPAPTAVAAAALAVDGVPPVVAAAYRAAAAQLAGTDPGCHLQWTLLAAIGRVESNNGASGGSTTPGWDGTARPPILGPVLDGSHGFALVRDTDGGRLDGNTRYDRAVGPMQFLPSTWRVDGRDGNGDGRRDPENIADAALAAAAYLCGNGGDLRNSAQLQAAVFSYNHSLGYVRTVLALAAAYASRSPLPTVPLPAAQRSTAPAVALGRPAAAPQGSTAPRTQAARPSAATRTSPPSPPSSPPTSPSSSRSPSPSPPPSSPSPSPSSPSPSPSPSPTPLFTVGLAGDPALPVFAVGGTATRPALPAPGRAGWWTASARPGWPGTAVLDAAAGTATQPGPFDPAALPTGTTVTVVLPAGPLRFRVVAHTTATVLPAPSLHGPQQLLLVSYDPQDGATATLQIVRAVPD